MSMFRGGRKRHPGMAYPEGDAGAFISAGNAGKSNSSPFPRFFPPFLKRVSVSI